MLHKSFFIFLKNKTEADNRNRKYIMFMINDILDFSQITHNYYQRPFSSLCGKSQIGKPGAR